MCRHLKPSHLLGFFFLEALMPAARRPSFIKTKNANSALRVDQAGQTDISVEKEVWIIGGSKTLDVQ